VLAALLAVWVVAGIYRIEEAERAVVLRLGKFHSVTEAGLHWRPWGIDTLYRVDVTVVKSLTMKNRMLTEDQNIIDVELNVQYRVAEPKPYFLLAQKPETALRNATESALRHVVGGSRMDQVLTEGREAIGIEVESRLQSYLQAYSTGLTVTNVNVKDAHPPEQVKAAFDDVIKAREDEERVQNEAQAYANGIVPEARGAAQRVMEESQAYKAEIADRATGEAERFSKLLAEYQRAPEITRQRLYLQTMEEVYGNTTKILLDIDDSNNLLYLPLDRMFGGAGSASAAPAPTRIPVVETTQTTREVTPMRASDRLREIRESRRWEGRQ
jgi:membrane protease subunit HflK